MEIDKNFHKCYFDLKGIFHPCNGVLKLLEYVEKIEITRLFNFTFGKERDLGLSIKKTKKHKGLCFNFCPFCRESCLDKNSKLGTDKIPYYVNDEQVKKIVESKDKEI